MNVLKKSRVMVLTTALVAGMLGGGAVLPATAYTITDEDNHFCAGTLKVSSTTSGYRNNRVYTAVGDGRLKNLAYSSSPRYQHVYFNSIYTVRKATAYGSKTATYINTRCA